MASPLDGTWKNQLGSTVYLDTTADGQVSGRYSTAVGNASGWYALRGTFDPTTATNVTFGFCVTWQSEARGSSQSSTCWSGFVNSRQELDTTWLLTRFPAPGSEWAAANVGKDRFVKI